uniref:Adenylate kinase active site lid domain-containing protein n=1 Tax=Peronospora matthiolae TaxID=2874970 RepID=A0AAV1VFN2_9STRA
MESGALVTDKIVVGIIKDDIKTRQDVDKGKDLGQRVHLASGRSNHVKFAPPNVDGKEDITGEPLI